MAVAQAARWSQRSAMLLALVGLSAGAFAAGCGSSSDRPSVAQGRDVFRNGTPGKLACGFCHTFRSAGTVGPFGPDLDNIFAGEFRENGASQQRMQQFVLHQLAHPSCADPKDPSRCMPTGLARGSAAQSVAMFVAKCAGLAGRSGTPRVAGCRPDEGMPRVTGLAAQGKRLYSSQGCISCHSLNGNVGVGPSFKGLAGARVKLVGGEKVTADRDYLATSILEPDAQTVDGFRRGVMSVRLPPGSLSPGQAAALVAFIQALPSGG
jgi:cytochrome c551/c552